MYSPLRGNTLGIRYSGSSKIWKENVLHLKYIRSTNLKASMFRRRYIVRAIGVPVLEKSDYVCIFFCFVLTELT